MKGPVKARSLHRSLPNNGVLADLGHNFERPVLAHPFVLGIEGNDSAAYLPGGDGDGSSGYGCGDAGHASQARGSFFRSTGRPTTIRMARSAAPAST